MKTQHLLWTLILIVALALVAAQCTIVLPAEQAPTGAEATSAQVAVVSEEGAESVKVEVPAVQVVIEKVEATTVEETDKMPVEVVVEKEVVVAEPVEEEIGQDVIPIVVEPQIEVIEAKASGQIGVVSEAMPETQQLPYTQDMSVLFEEMTLVRVLSEEYARINAVCAGVGLNNIRPLPDQPMILIPNAGDLSVDGSNVAIKLSPDGEITFIPRVQGQRIRVPVDLGDKLAGYEVVDLTLEEAMQLMAADKLIWTARGQGPYGTGHGLAGHIAECDPRYYLEPDED